MVSSFIYKEFSGKRAQKANRWMTTVAKESIIKTLSYPVEEAYCRPESDFARVVSSGSDREEFSPDEGFHIRRGSFSYGKEETANVSVHFQ